MAKIQLKAGITKEPDYADSAKLSGEEYSKLRRSAMDYYRLNKKSADYKNYTLDYVKNSKWSNKYEIIQKNPDNAFNATLGALCRMLSKGMAPVHAEYNAYWESLPGTMGTPKPLTFFVEDQLQGLFDHGEKIIEEKKEIQKEKIDVYVPTIQQRIQEQCTVMVEFIEVALDDFSDEKIKDFKSIKPLNTLRQLQCKQPHARNIKTFYEEQLKEYHEVLNPPDTSKMSELEKDYVKQLKDGYANYSKSQIKKLYDFLGAVLIACDSIIAESKANRKPRKISAKSPEKVVEKLKYKISDEKYGSSVEPHKFIMANMLVVFNCKNRKLGVYYTSNEDPLGQKRDGTGLYLKGQTIQRFDDKRSIWKVLRKPNEQLLELRKLTTRKKFENWYEQIKTTETKMNGRINPETMLLGVYQ